MHENYRKFTSDSRPLNRLFFELELERGQHLIGAPIAYSRIQNANRIRPFRGAIVAKTLLLLSVFYDSTISVIASDMQT